MNRMDRNSDQAVKFMEDQELRGFITRLIGNKVCDRIQAEMKAALNYKFNIRPVTDCLNLLCLYFQQLNTIHPCQ